MASMLLSIIHQVKTVYVVRYLSSGPGQAPYRPAWRTAPASLQQTQTQTHYQTSHFPNNRYQPPQPRQVLQQQSYPDPHQQQFRQPQNSYAYNSNPNHRSQAALNIQRMVVQHPTPQAPSSTQSSNQYQLLQEMLNAKGYPMPKPDPPTPPVTTKQSRQSDFLNEFMGKSSVTGTRPTPFTALRPNPSPRQSNSNTQQLLTSLTAPRNAPASR